MRTRVHLCPFLETDGTPLKNRFELFSLLKPADDLPLFWLDVAPFRLNYSWLRRKWRTLSLDKFRPATPMPFNGKCSCGLLDPAPVVSLHLIVHNFLRIFCRKRIPFHCYQFLWMCFHVWRVFFLFCFWFFVNDFEF